jgi:hypothetical protein
MFIGSTPGGCCEVKLPTSGEYLIQVYMIRICARRDETAKFKLDIGLD